MEATLGIDLASQRQNTALCVIAWNDGRAEVRALAEGAWDGRPLDDGLLTRAIREQPGKVAIDAPFGWPAAFVAAVHAHHGLVPWPADYGGQRKHYARRATDLFVHERTGKTPLSVSTDRIAYCAMRCAAILGQLERRLGAAAVARDGSGRVVEAYPDAALRRWLPAEWVPPRATYKGATALARRQRLVSALLAGLGPRFAIHPEHRADCVRSDDCLDALVCALVARAARLHRTIEPDDRRLARTEGWIHLPRDGSLSALV
jgi:predicted nuclease with RNAse H fold